MNSVKIGSRLALVFAAMLALTCTLGIFSTVELAVVKKASTEVSD